MLRSDRAIIQEHYPPGLQSCFGCGRGNAAGLQIGCWQEGGEVVTQWQPPDHLQGPRGMLHGGITALLMDEVASAAAFVEFHRRAGKSLGEMPPPFFVTANLNIDYQLPVPISGAVTLRARPTEPRAPGSRKVWIECTLSCNERCAARSRVLLVRLPETSLARERL